MLGRLVLPLIAVLPLAGCGEGAPRAAVSGHVTVDGKPLARGVIRFVPSGDTEGPLAAAEIIDGDYALDAERGPVVGEQRVEILADESDQIPFDLTDPAAYQKHGPVPPPRQPLPPKYNTQSTLTAAIEADAENTADFSLSNRP